MTLDDIVCPCGAPVVPLQDDAGVFLQCAEDCGLVDAAPGPSVEAAIAAWQAALPPPTVEVALETYILHSASALVYAQTPQELVQLAPLAQVLISYLQLPSTPPPGDDPT
jgi:hypothetical protein